MCIDPSSQAPDTDSRALTATQVPAPTAGFLAMTGTVEAFNFTADDGYGCQFRLDGTMVSGSSMVSQLDGLSSTNENENCTTMGFVEVAAGVHTVDFRLTEVETTTDFSDGSMWVLFVPFDGTGGTP